MLGHKLWQVFSKRFDTYVSFRESAPPASWRAILGEAKLMSGVDALHFDSVVRLVGEVHPEVVVNCLGIIKQRKEAQDPILSLTTNSLLPHRLADLCRAARARLIQISTDCVFSGQKGSYNEADPTDPDDLYGRSKLLGEVTGEGCLTIRTSIIGRELGTSNGLVEWFLTNRGGQVRGYTRAIYSGFPTIILAEALADVIEKQPHLSGIYHVSSDPISKYELLCLLRTAYRAPVEIEPYADFHCNRALDSTRFRAATGFLPAPWTEMIRMMAADPTPYDEWSAQHGSRR
jgi:dTDP-4-dehydrorhamnose reductase